MKKSRQQRKAFSLLEVLIVLAILALLVAIVAPRLLKSRSKANESVTKLTMTQIEESLKQFKVDFDRYPTTEEGLEILLKKPSDDVLAAKWSGPYFDEDVVTLPVDAWGYPFKYELPTEQETQSFPIIKSPGPDGEENTADDITSRKAVEGDEKESKSKE
jgi:general secretion pathway protein G